MFLISASFLRPQCALEWNQFDFDLFTLDDYVFVCHRRERKCERVADDDDDVDNDDSGTVHVE